MKRFYFLIPLVAGCLVALLLGAGDPDTAYFPNINVATNVTIGGVLTVGPTNVIDELALKAHIASPALTGTPTINGNNIPTNWVDSGTSDSTLAGTASAGAIVATNGLYGLPAHAQREHLYFDDADEHDTLTLTNNNMALMRFAGGGSGIGGVWMGSAREGDFAIMAGVEEEGYPIDVFRAKHTNAVEFAISNDARMAYRIDTGLTPGNTFAMTDRMVVTPTGVGIWDDAALNNRVPAYALDLQKASRNQFHISYGIVDSGLWIASGAASDGGLSVGAIYDGAQFVAKGTEAGWLTFGGGGNWYFRDDTGLTAGVAYAPTTRIFIKGADGNVGIGNTTAAERLDVTGNIKASGSFIVAGTTNQVVFGATNTAPVSSAAPTKWISVQVTGEATVYRLPLYE